MDWNTIATIDKNTVTQNEANIYIDYGYKPGNNYYRIAQLSHQNKKIFSHSTNFC